MKTDVKLCCLVLLTTVVAASQPSQDSLFVNGIVKEVGENSQVEVLAHELMDGVGPRLVGTPQMKKAHDWIMKKYESWGIAARNEKWGEWRGWERGISHVDMIHPWVKTLQAKSLAWSPGTHGKTISGEAIILPEVRDSMGFIEWLPLVKGKFVMISMCQPTGRPDYNWTEFGTRQSVERMKANREKLSDAWQKRISNTRLNNKGLVRALEKAGAAGILASHWSEGFGANKIFGAYTTKIPVVDISLEDYGLLFRLAESGQRPGINLRVDSRELGMVPTFNTLGEIRGTEFPDEYVMLSAHLDSWDGATGATDNGTGTIVMMEAMRLLKKLYPNPKRTILVGHWGGEEQGLNGSRSFVEDHPEIVEKIQALFNQDNGTGRVVSLSGQGFLNAYEYLSRWLAAVPAQVKDQISTLYPGMPGSGGSDYASFVAVGVPAFSLSSLSWSYGTYTWHTNLDTYDKIVFDDLKNNVILTAVLAYKASEDPHRASMEKALLPLNPSTGEREPWPGQKPAMRRGGLD